MDLERAIIQILGRFNSLDWKTTVKLALMDRGCYDFAAEQKLKTLLGDLRKRGVIVAASEWGPYMLVTPAIAAGVPAERERARRQAGWRRALRVR
jgi:hypothetical protein